MKQTTFLRAVLLTCLFNLGTLYAQTKPINFQDFTIEMPDNINNFSWSQLSQSNSSDSGHYVILQFDKAPNQSVQNEFRNRNIELRDYISNSSYFVYISNTTSISFLKNSGVISIASVPQEFKMSSKVRNGEIGNWAQQGDNILVNLHFHTSLGLDKLTADLNSVLGVSVVEQYKGMNLIQVSIPGSKVNQVVNLPSVKWVELIPEPDVKEDNRGRSIHRSSNLDTQTITGRNYTGEGIGVMVRDDGIVGTHIDFQGRIDNSAASGTGQTHGDGVAGILAGAGNLDPTKRGMAAGSSIFVTNYVSSFLDAATQNLINNGDVQITNSSYGNGCNAGYTSTSRTVDSQSNTILSLLHVFSAGNSGTSNCSYGAGSGWGNITGGHKQGKNVIATANVFFDGSQPSHSSNGPAYDGRIKPDITAHGQGQLSTDENNGYLTFGGTSGAAPGIAGVSAQLYQLYADEHGGDLPEAALIKAALLNTANDYGNVGPDFQFGWGLVNGLRAAMLLEDDRFFDEEIAQDDTNNHTIDIPGNTVQVRFMLYWNDPSAVAGASTALVNDLDLVVTTPSNNQLLPWVLDSTPDPVALNTPATNGIDRLNNMEQVLINNPEEGEYTLDISGFNVPVGPQKYYIVYEVITEELTLTYPIGGEKLVPGEQVPIHWDAVNTTESFELEYSDDNGATWNAIATASSTATNYNWSIPGSLETSGEYLVRITSGSFSDESEDPFSLAKTVTGIEVVQVCSDRMSIAWNTMEEAESYNVYLLGEKFMELVGNSTDTFLSFPISDSSQTFWFAVAAEGSDWESRRSIATRWSGGELNCSSDNDLSVNDLNSDLSSFNPICTGDNSFDVAVQLRNLGILDQSNFKVSYQLNSEAIVEENFTDIIEPGNQEIFTFSSPLEVSQSGNNSLRIWVTLTGDQNSTNDEVDTSFYVQIDPDNPNEVEDFETSGFLPDGWNIINPDNSTTWVERTNTTGIDDQAGTVAYINNFNYNAPGAEDIFETLIYDLDGTGMNLLFDLAKAQYSSTLSDGLRVEVSDDCGVTYTTVYEKEGLTLSTLPAVTTANWSPSNSSHWRTETIDLSAYDGQTIKVRFINVNGYGNGTFIDNVRVEGTLSTPEEGFDQYFSLFPNPAQDRFTIVSSNVRVNKLEMYSLIGKRVKIVEIDENQQRINVDVQNLPSGVYVVRLESEVGTSFKKIIKN